MERKNFARWILIAGLAFVFGYFGIDKFLNPDIWIGWMPLWMDGLLGLPRETWLMITGALEILFALLLLIPVRNVQKAGAVLIVLHLIAVLTQTGWNDIAVRDIGLLMMGVALFVL